MHRNRLLPSVAAVLLTASMPAPASADGGAGGASTGYSGGAGGTGYGGAAGQNGPGAGAGGGGGGGAGGGTGGAGGGWSGATSPGGAGGSSSGSNGQDAPNARALIGGGGGGGGGNGNGAGTATVANSGTMTGGSGGRGGNGGDESGGGGGGAGGYGAIVTGTAASSNSGTIQAGAGGAGGAGRASTGHGGNGGDGGIGVLFTNSSATVVTFTNTGTVSGGDAGAAGGADVSSQHGSNGAAGVGIVGKNLTVINSGTIAGGTNVGGGSANAVTFTGGNNTLQLRAGSTVTGNVVDQTGNGTFQLGGSSSSSLAVSTIGAAAQYQGFSTFQSVGSGTWTLTGTNNSTMSWAVNSGSLLVNGSMTGTNFTVNSGGLLSGSGTIGSTTVNSGGTVQPGDTYVTLNIVGAFTQGSGSTYAPSVNAAGQSDRINVTGTATIQTGATVSVQAASGSYARNTTYTILTATGGVTGTYSRVTSNLAFLTPSLSYDTDNVYLTLLSSGTSFRSGARTGNQFAVGAVLDRQNAGATGDFATVLNALYALDTVQGPKALDAISGQPIANFGTTNAAMSSAVMNTIGNTLASFHGGMSGGSHVAMANGGADGSCDFTCDADPQKYGAWISGVGGMGSVLGNTNSATLTYSMGGTAVGADYAFSQQFKLGIGASYVGGTQWVNGFSGNSTSDAVSGFLYASYDPGKLYVDGMAGYTYANNRSNRSIVIPGLAPRIAIGSTVANQFMAQLETGYKVDLIPALAATPFARLQGSTTSQNGFTESGADSLNLAVAGQTTNSLRTTLGADFSASIAHMDFDVRLGWEHENADTGRPMTASFAGAPGNAFTVYGATPQRDSAVVGFAFKTVIAEATELYARYDGEISVGSNNNAFTLGLRMTW
ncbi:outer membrane autotransporter barrel domain-containing protein [Enhydrobacter aerosaccus]|uniref:Outer membrane autotransporter barrel domain-containing protein n=1 Tax=Enhydrobacter aerosaccus TaxID=225324 RepID=A0A1T4TEH1_9HYPH|nr:autotransporter outer membrane beta-barrel domain-containing protein [Enhydrobacter aerosaccus]SKA38837.1 outer membrane autotransporter barrel domain-containing protein [Enhydrobacter aerosaccus]